MRAWLFSNRARQYELKPLFVLLNQLPKLPWLTINEAMNERQTEGDEQGLPYLPDTGGGEQDKHCSEHHSNTPYGPATMLRQKRLKHVAIPFHS
jgi:hypothetical protein